MSGWPSGLRRQTQVLNLPEYRCTGCSGPRMWAWVRIPLLTKGFGQVSGHCQQLENRRLLAYDRRSKASRFLYKRHSACAKTLGQSEGHTVAWPSGLRRWFKAPVSSEAWVRIPPLPRTFTGDYMRPECQARIRSANRGIHSCASRARHHLQLPRRADIVQRQMSTKHCSAPRPTGWLIRS